MLKLSCSCALCNCNDIPWKEFKILKEINKCLTTKKKFQLTEKTWMKTKLK